MNAVFKVLEGGRDAQKNTPQERVMGLEREYGNTFQVIIQHLQFLFPNFPKAKNSYFRMVTEGTVYAVYGSIHIRFPADIRFDEIRIPLQELSNWEITPNNSPSQSVADILSSKQVERGSVGRSTNSITLRRKTVKEEENVE